MTRLALDASEFRCELRIKEAAYGKGAGGMALEAVRNSIVACLGEVFQGLGVRRLLPAEDDTLVARAASQKRCIGRRCTY